MTLLELGRVDVEDLARELEAPPLGVHDWPAEVYHADPVPGGSASSTTLRRILADGGPAVVRYRTEHPETSDDFDFGGAAHTIVLGRGDEIVEVVADDWRTNAAKAKRDEARAEHKRPLLSKDLRRAELLAAAVLEHPVAGPLFAPEIGVHERGVLWQDGPTGEYCRAMLDVFPHLDGPGVPVAVDLKTTTGVELRKLTRTVLEYGYHQQAAHYLEGLASVGAVDCDFLFVFVTKEPPHLVRVVRLGPRFLELGRDRNRRALDLWAWCRESDTWPGIPEGIDEIDAPAWALNREDDAS